MRILTTALAGVALLLNSRRKPSTKELAAQ